MAIERRTIFRDGDSKSFVADVEIVADFIEPCSYCGVPCSGTTRIWYVEGHTRKTFETDRGALSDLMDDLVREAIEKDAYEALPAFVRCANEATGWATFLLEDGAVVSADDLLLAVNAMEANNSDDRITRMLSAIRKLVGIAVAGGHVLWAGST